MRVRDVQHPILPRATADELARQRAVVNLRKLLNSRVRSQNVRRFHEEGAPAFAERHGRQPQSPDEIEQALFESVDYRLWSAANRSAQEMIWVSVGEPIFRDRARMQAAAAELAAAPDRKGSLTLRPGEDISPEVAGTDVHLQPGGYARDDSEDDVVAGAFYETGGNVFSFGQGAGKGDSKAGVVFRLLETDFPELVPNRILDLGCSAGAASAAYADRFPDAQVHAIDIGAGMLRYAHARAEALGVAVHFHQMDAADLRFADGSFDLVVSHNMLHEIGAEKRRRAMAEALRVVRPGGLVIFQDVDTRFAPTEVHKVEKNWDTRFNGELFWKTYNDADLLADMRAAGFAADSVREHAAEAVSNINRWYVVSGRKPEQQA
ncbi:class I SAM-dependent methyltransferase [Sphingomonas sp. HITSZ_GF]|uniref:class I SAM-dependent methyltransferase n=1 Tax=Sphingomonas sp. HITSZ_GF TaxID=3037247 RepID=UPI00240D5361|nr:class I SAM-dependent methyltransferase [Sphingomonas sp. HITSZ_GF]MDG2532141.1 class I SAM-dependent methyltransferase [Sphingomonas sp. HITSZ_GF]